MSTATSCMGFPTLMLVSGARAAWVGFFRLAQTAHLPHQICTSWWWPVESLLQSGKCLLYLSMGTQLPYM